MTPKCGKLHLRALSAFLLSLLSHQTAAQEPSTENQWTEYIQSTVETYSKDHYVFDKAIWDHTRPDLNGPMAIEVDWSTKWKEGVGQACYYAEALDKPGAVLLLFKNGLSTDSHRIAAYKAKLACKRANLKLLLYDCVKKEFR